MGLPDTAAATELTSACRSFLFFEEGVVSSGAADLYESTLERDKLILIRDLRGGEFGALGDRAGVDLSA